MILLRYLGKEVYGALLASTFILLALLISNQFVHYLTQAAAGVIPIRTVMQMMSIQIPLLLGILLPLGLYVGILMSYGRLYTDREMIVLFACGFSKIRLLGYTFGFACIVAGVVAWIMLIVQPSVEKLKRQILLEAATASPLEKVFPGQFIKVGSNLTFYVQKLSADHQKLYTIFAAQPQAHPNKTVWNITVAAEGEQMQDPKTQDHFLVLKNGYRYTGVPGQLDFQIVQYKTYGIRIEPNAIPADTRVDTISTKTLWQDRHQRLAYETELQWRLSLPIMALVLTLIALPLSRVDPRQGRFARLLPALLIYTAYLNLLFAGKIWLGKGQIPPYIGLWGIHLIFLGLGIVLIGYFIGWRQIKAQMTRSQTP